MTRARFRMLVLALGMPIGVMAVLPLVREEGPAVSTPVMAQPAAPAADVSSPATLRLNGLVEAVHFYSVMTPRVTGTTGPQRLTIVRLAPKGTMVRKGDVIVEFDRQTQVRTALDKRAELIDLEEQIRKMQADQAARRAQDETALKAAENAVALARLEVLKNPLLPVIEAEKNTLALEAAEAKLASLTISHELRRKADEADLRILEVRRARAAAALGHAERNAEKMLVRSPIDGLVVLKTIWKGDSMGEPQEGEELWPGSAILDVVGPEAMRVRVRVNQADMPYLRVGQTATVTLDAYPGTSYPARLTQLSPVGVVGQFSQKVRTFVALVDIDGSSPQLAPDLSAAVDVNLDGSPHGTR